MSAHTPGPWALQMAEDCQGRQLDDMVKWVVTANANDLWISTGPTWDAEHDAESIANARLIAAAPDSLAANLATVTALDEAFGIKAIHDDGYIYDTLPSSGIARAYFMARAAIASATGAK